MNWFEENADRCLGGTMAIITTILGLYVLGSFNWSSSWFICCAATIALGVWVYNGWTRTYIAVGSKGEILLLGSRTKIITGEGQRWTPFPFSAKETNCQQTVIKLDELKAVTSDDATVTINGSLIVQVDDPHKYADINPEDRKKGFDDAWDRVLRHLIRNMSLNDALKSEDIIKLVANGKIQEHVSGLDWGVKVLKVNIAGIKTDEKVSLAMELKVTENKEREGQEIEIAHFNRQVDTLMKAGFSREQAIEQVQHTIGWANPKTTEAKVFSVDPASAAIIAAAFGRKPE